MTQIDRIEGKIDKISDKLSEHGAILSAHQVLHEKNTTALDDHIRRTNLLEERMTKYEDETSRKLGEALLPIKLLKAFAALVAVLSALAGIVKILRG